MNTDPSATRPQVPPPALRGYSGPLTGHQPNSDYLHHPLHRVYRRRMRGSRVIWFVLGTLFGGLLVFALIFLLSALVYTRIPKVVHNFTGDPDVTITITEGYLSSEAQSRLGEDFRTINPNLTLLAVQILVSPENRIDYEANFHINIPFFAADVSASVKNQINVQDGKLVMNMVGDPQLGNLNLPLDALPFNLKGEIARTVDSVNNGLVVAEMNTFLNSSLNGTSFFLDGVTTDDKQIVLRLRQR